MPIHQPSVSLAEARAIVSAALAKGAELGLKPLGVAVLDAAGHLKAFERQDGATHMRLEIAVGKAHGAVALGIGSRAIFKRAQEQAFFVSAVNTLARGSLVPVPGGVLIRDADGAVVGAVGISGDNSDNDEAAAIAGIQAAGLVADPGLAVWERPSLSRRQPGPDRLFDARPPSPRPWRHMGPGSRCAWPG